MSISLIRTILLYIIIILAVKLMGKRQISDLQTSELVVTLLISNIAAIPMQNTGQPLISGVIPIAVLISCEVIISFVMLKNSKFRRAVCGRPIVIIKDGKLEQNELKRLRMSTEDMFQQLRQMNIFSIQDVAFAIVETNGQMSVMKKYDKQQPDASTLGVVIPDKGIDTVVISDGEICDFSLSVCGLTKDWVQGVLQGQNININEIFIMTANKTKEYHIIKKEISA